MPHNERLMGSQTDADGPANIATGPDTVSRSVTVTAPIAEPLAEKPPAERSELATGMLLALLGFSCLSLGDGFMKSLAGLWPGTGVAALRYTIGALGLGVLLFIREGRAGFRFPRPKVQIARGFFVATATVAFFSSIFLMPLATATAVQFTSPMFTAIISAILLKEAATRGTWGTSLVAFCGVLLVLRPDFAALGWAAILPLLASFSMACLMIANRKAAGSGSVLLMQFLIAIIGAGFLVIAAIIGHLTGIAILQLSMPNWYVVAICSLVAVSASFSHMLVYQATARASAAAISPMVYVQLLLALVIGMTFYGDYPDAISCAGVILIIGAGIYLWRHNRK